MSRSRRRARPSTTTLAQWQKTRLAWTNAILPFFGMRCSTWSSESRIGPSTCQTSLRVIAQAGLDLQRPPLYSVRLNSAIIMAARSEPLSIELLLQKQREEKEAAAKVGRCFSQAVTYTDHPVLRSLGSLLKSNAPNWLFRNVRRRSRSKGTRMNAPRGIVRLWSAMRRILGRRNESGTARQGMVVVAAGAVRLPPCFGYAFGSRTWI